MTRMIDTPLAAQNRRTILSQQPKILPLARLNHNAKGMEHVGLARPPRSGHRSGK